MFEENFYYAQNRVNGTFLDPKFVKSDCFGYLRKIHIVFKMKNGSFLGSKSTFFKFYLNLFIRVLKRYLIAGIKSWKKMTVRILKKNYYVLNGVNGSFLGTESALVSFSPNLFIRYLMAVINECVKLSDSDFF